MCRRVSRKNRVRKKSLRKNRVRKKSLRKNRARKKSLIGGSEVSYERFNTLIKEDEYKELLKHNPNLIKRLEERFKIAVKWYIENKDSHLNKQQTNNKDYDINYYANLIVVNHIIRVDLDYCLEQYNSNIDITEINLQNNKNLKLNDFLVDHEEFTTTFLYKPFKTQQIVDSDHTLSI